MGRKPLKTDTMEAQVARVVEFFYETYRVTGKVEVEFETPRTVPDSDLNSIINVVLRPRDEESRSFVEPNIGHLHLQFLDDEIHPGVFGYRYEAQIQSKARPGDTEPSDQAEIEVSLEALADKSR